MESTLQPEVIYQLFDRQGFPVSRIDHFDRGDYAEIRAELQYEEPLNPQQLQEIALKLMAMEKNEGISLEVVNVDMVHHSMRINLRIGRNQIESR